MNISPSITDNITELLVKIIDFTKSRNEVLINNVNNVHASGFIPKDLAAKEFSILMSHAINEHVQNGRLLLCDTENFKFGRRKPSGHIEHARAMCTEQHRVPRRYKNV